MVCTIYRIKCMFTYIIVTNYLNKLDGAAVTIRAAFYKIEINLNPVKYLNINVNKINK